jgi:two-component system chemotaxis response regulator CheB
MKRDIIVIGTSAGGVEALTKIVPEFRPGFPAAVFVVCHIPPVGSRGLANLLGLRARLPVSFATDSVTVERGTVRVAPPDCHLLLRDGQVVLTRGPKQNRARPAIDPLFRSAALAYGPRVIGVVLTGLLDDGAAGLLEVKRRGGLAIVQHPSDAQFPDMPRNALSATEADYCVPLSDVAPLLARLCTEEIPEAARPAPGVSELEARADAGELVPMDRLGKPSAYSCPECCGVLWEVNDPALLRFRCRVGHSFSAEGLVSEHHKVTEDALWAAARSLEERAGFARRLSDRCRTSDLQDAAAQYELRADNDEAHAASIIAMLTRSEDRTASNEH